jgi:hypothetical protein
VLVAVRGHRRRPAAWASPAVKTVLTAGRRPCTAGARTMGRNVQEAS